MAPPQAPAQEQHAATIRCGVLTIDRERYRVTVSDQPVELTYMEFHVLLAIAERAGRVASYEELGREFWDDASASTRRWLAVLVSRTRSKLGDAAPYLDTVHRVGYRLTSP